MPRLPTYKRYMKSETGKKIITLLRIMTEGIRTRKELEERTRFSTSEVRKLLLKAEEKDLIIVFDRGKLSKKRGKPRIGEFEKETGRPPLYYVLTGDGLWLMFSDPHVMDNWKQVQATYKDLNEFSNWDSYLNLQHAIQTHPILKEYRKPYYFMGEELEQVPLNPFIWGVFSEDKIEKVYDELVKAIKESVKPDHISSYYRALDEAVLELNETIARYKRLMKKMQTLPKVQEYISRHK